MDKPILIVDPEGLSAALMARLALDFELRPKLTVLSGETLVCESLPLDFPAEAIEALTFKHALRRCEPRHPALPGPTGPNNTRTEETMAKEGIDAYVRKPEDEPARWSRCTFDADVPLRQGPLIYLGTERGYGADIPRHKMTREDAARIEAEHRPYGQCLYVRVVDVVRVERRDEGCLLVTYLTHQHPSKHSYSSGTGFRVIECDEVQYEQFNNALWVKT